MKKLTAGILTAALAMSIGVSGVFAAGQKNNFKDADNNGVCDNIESGICAVQNEKVIEACRQAFSLSSFAGCRGRIANAAETGRACNFKDEDGDEVCDNRGQYCNFEDSDNDGVCDNYNSGKHNRNRGAERGYCLNR